MFRHYITQLSFTTVRVIFFIFILDIFIFYCIVGSRYIYFYVYRLYVYRYFLFTFIFYKILLTFFSQSDNNWQRIPCMYLRIWWIKLSLISDLKLISIQISTDNIFQTLTYEGNLCRTLYLYVLTLSFGCLCEFWSSLMLFAISLFICFPWFLAISAV